MKEKYDLIQASERISKPTQKDLASMFGVGKTTVSDILKRKEFTRKTQHLNVKDMTRAVNTES
jgi:transposase